MNTELQNEIMERLQKGENIEDIAQEFTDVINKVNTQYKLDQAEAQKKSEALKHEKVLAISSLIDAVSEIGKAWGFQEEAEKLVKNISQEDIEEIIDSFDETFPIIMQYATMFEALNKNIKSAPKAKETAASAKSGENAIEDFLDMFVR